MSYRVKQEGNTWRVIRDWYEAGKRYQKRVKQTELRELGFYEGMSLEEAKSWANHLSKVEQDRKASIKHENIQKRLDSELISLVKMMPEPFFTQWIGVVTKKYDAMRTMVQIRRMRKVLVRIPTPIEDWAETPQLFYQEFVRMKCSADTAWRTLKIINEWGYYYCKKTGKPFLPIPMPRGKWREALTDAFAGTGKEKKSPPLRPDGLNQAKNNLSEQQFNWLSMTVWFGLRPEEVNPEYWKAVEIDGVKALMVYQPKLIAVKKEDRYKVIPLIFPEQIKVLTLAQTQGVDRPLPKTVKKYTGCTLYGGRKGFVKLMKSRDRDLEEISAWMGHKSMDRTRNDYEEKGTLVLKRKG